MTTEILLVLSPVDLGSRTLGLDIRDSLSHGATVETHFFTAESGPPRGRLALARRYLGRASRVMALWAAIVRARRRRNVVVFQGTTALTFAYPLLRRTDCVCITDWTRSLRGEFDARRPPDRLARVQGRVFRRVGLFFALTRAVEVNLIDVYGVAAHRIQRVAPPVSIASNSHPPQRESKPALLPRAAPVRLLFVGGDLIRKGGDLLISWVESRRDLDVELTVVTATPAKSVDKRIRIVNGVSRGTPEHHAIYQNADVFVLPTQWDAFPMALAEAVAMGLPVAVTTAALGHDTVLSDGKNGIVRTCPSDLFDALSDALETPGEIARMKAMSLVQARQLEPGTVGKQILSKISHSLALA